MILSVYLNLTAGIADPITPSLDKLIPYRYRIIHVRGNLVINQCLLYGGCTIVFYLRSFVKFLNIFGVFSQFMVSSLLGEEMNTDVFSQEPCWNPCIKSAHLKYNLQIWVNLKSGLSWYSMTLHIIVYTGMVSSELCSIVAT